MLCHSLLRHTSRPISIIPLKQEMLRAQGWYTRERGPTESTEFSMTRFLVPYLCQYRGYALFLDCDMVCLSDIHELLAYTDSHPFQAVYVCQHDYTPSTEKKFLGQPQTVYPRKNWSSVMLFNNHLCRNLTLPYVNQASGLELHRFQWLSDEQIGSLPLSWNHLVGEYEDNSQVDLLHYTIGTPCFPEYADGPMSEYWWREYELMMNPLEAYANLHVSV